MVALAIPMGVGRFAFTPILPMMQADAGLSITAGGWLAFANYAGTLGGALAAMAVRAPLPVAIRGGLVAIGGATVAMGLEGRFAVWIALRALAGVATGCSSCHWRRRGRSNGWRCSLPHCGPRSSPATASASPSPGASVSRSCRSRRDPARPG